LAKIKRFGFLQFGKNPKIFLKIFAPEYGAQDSMTSTKKPQPTMTSPTKNSNLKP